MCFVLVTADDKFDRANDCVQMKISRDMGSKGKAVKPGATKPSVKPGARPESKPKRATVGRPRKVDGSLIAADRILDAAEDLFSKRGFDGVTMREVTELANLDAALAHYYFATKQGLFDAVLERRAELVFPNAWARSTRMRPRTVITSR